jgi:histone acetyltransferase
VLLQLVLNDLQNENSAWPFTKPVDGTVVADYYDVITEPMGMWTPACVMSLNRKLMTDLQTMEYKLENNHYASIDDFVHDAQLIFTNCRRYNGEKSTYTTQANKLEKALDRIMKKRNVYE